MCKTPRQQHELVKFIACADFAAARAINHTTHCMVEYIVYVLSLANKWQKQKSIIVNAWAPHTVSRGFLRKIVDYYMKAAFVTEHEGQSTFSASESQLSRALTSSVDQHPSSSLGGSQKQADANKHDQRAFPLSGKEKREDIAWFIAVVLPLFRRWALL